MIKRLTDDPMPLRQALPTGNFPPALQAAMDRALARYASERYPDAVQFADDVQKAIAGFAPEGGATMIVGANDMKTMVAGAAPSTSAVPKTRVASAAEKSGGADTQPAAKKSPVMAIAAGVVVLALAGGGYAMFGRGTSATPPVAPSDSGTKVVQESTPQVATNPGTAPAQQQQQQNTQLSSRPTNVTPPPVTGNPRPNNTPAAPKAPTKAELDSLTEAAYDSPEIRAPNITRGKQLWANKGLDNETRAQAAMMVGNMYFLDGYRSSAKAWGDSALTLTPDNATRRTRVESWTRE